jgi:hypothetical protein
MKKIRIKIEYRDKTYLSDIIEANEEEESKIKNSLEFAAKGELTYMNFECNNQQQYFSKEILVQSVLTLVYEV